MAQFTFIPQLQQNQQPNIVDTLAALGGAYAQKKQKSQQRMEILEALKQRGFTPQASQALSALPESILRDLFKSGPEQGKNEEQISLLRDIFQKQGINPDVALIENPSLQQAFVKNALKPESLAQVIGRYAERLLPGQSSSSNNQSGLVYNNKNEPIGVNINNTLVPLKDLSPETISNLKTLNQPKTLSPEQRSTLGEMFRRAGQFGTGALTQLAGIPGDVLQLGSSIGQALGMGKDALSPEQRKNSIAHWKDQLKKLDPNTNEYSQAQEILNDLENPQPAKFPTADVIRQEGINPLIKGTPVEEYVTPQDDLDEFIQDIGGTTALLTQPTKHIPTLLTNALKAGGVSLGGDFAGWLTKNVTGSDKLGNAIKNGTYLMYNLFPGLTGRLGQKTYTDFAQKVINPAIEQGKTVDLKPYKGDFESIAKKIDNRFPVTSDAANFLRTEAAKIKDVMGSNHIINSDALLNNIKEMETLSKGSSKDVNDILKQLINIQSRAFIKLNNAKNKGKIKVNDYKNTFDNILKKIDNFSPNTPQGSLLRKEASKVSDIMGYDSKINPDALWNNIKEMGSYFDKAPDQAKGVFKELIDLQKKALTDFSNTIIPNGGKLLENANDFWRTSHLIQDDLSFIKQVSNPRNYGAGALFWLSGGFPLVMKASMGAAGGKFVSNMLRSPAVRESITQLAKASSAQNATLVNKLINKLDKDTEKILGKMTPQDAKKVRTALEQAKSA